MPEALQMRRPNEAAIPPRNVADAAARFLCPVLGQLPGQRCVELFRDGERRRTPCSGCAAGKARAGLLGQGVRVVEVPTPAPDVAELRAQVAKLAKTLADAMDRIASLEVELEVVRNVASHSRPRAASVRMGEISFSLVDFDLDGLHAWCRQRDMSLSHLVRSAIRAHALATMGVDLPAYASGVCKGFGGMPNRRTRVDVPEAWSRFLGSLTAKRELSAFVRVALTTYLEAHP